MAHSASDVKALRARVQQHLALNITAGQDWCAAALHTTRRSYQQWESGDRKMHDAFYELLQIKTEALFHSVVAIVHK